MTAKGGMSRWTKGIRYSGTRMLEDHRWIWVSRWPQRWLKFKTDMASEVEWCKRRRESSGWHNGARVHI
jgi:hypothetical protein